MPVTFTHMLVFLRELYAAVPGVRQSMLGIHAKRFGEKYRHLQVDLCYFNIHKSAIFLGLSWISIYKKITDDA